MTDALQLARVHLDGGRPAEALNALAPYLAENPSSSAALRVQALALFGLARHDEAVEAANAAVAATPDDAASLVVLSVTLWASGDARAAVTAAERACAADPRNARAHLARGTALLAARRTEEALDAADETVRLAPHDPYGHDLRCRVLVALRRHDEAEEAARAALRLCPDDAEFLNGLGLAQLGAGHKREALETFRSAARLDPSSHASRRNTHRAVLASARAGVVLALWFGLRGAVRFASEERYGAAAFALAFGAVMLLLFGWRPLPEPGKAYVRAYARLHAPTRRAAVAAGIYAFAATVALVVAARMYGEVGARIALQVAIVGALGWWVTRWRRTWPDEHRAPSPLKPRVPLAVVEAASAVIVVLVVLSPTLGHDRTEGVAGWFVPALWLAYLGYADGVLGASAWRRVNGRLVVVDARTRRRIGFARGLLRAVAKVALAPLLPLALRDEHRRAPHDRVARTLVVRSRG